MMKQLTLLRTTLFVAALAATLCALSANGQELVTNGGFETGDFTGWTLSTPNDIQAQNIGTDSVFANSGNDYANLAGDPGPDSLTQVLITTPGTTYTFSFWLAHDVTTAPDNSFDASFGGASVLSFTNLGVQPYTQYSFDLTATGTSTPISFTYRDGDDFFRLDDVSVQQAVPEPSTIALGLIGLGVVGFVLRSRRATTA